MLVGHKQAAMADMDDQRVRVSICGTSAHHIGMLWSDCCYHQAQESEGIGEATGGYKTV